MITHKEAGVLFGKCRNKHRGYRLADQTYLRKLGHAFAVRYYNTDIVIIRPDGTYRINSGGRRTITTQRRMSMILPCHVSQKNWMWCIGNFHYTDGMLIDNNGEPINAEQIYDIHRIKRAVDRTVSGFTRLATSECQYRRIGTWDSFRTVRVPCLTNEIYIKKLWKLICDTVVEGCSISDGSYGHPVFKLIHTAALDYGLLKQSWDQIQVHCLGGKIPSILPRCLTAFMKQRKVVITEMIAAGALCQ